jgi:tetratricopeptide (TPR) repeat protein
MAESIADRATPRNPLGVIALFVFLIETMATVSLHAVAEKPYAAILVWFIVIFPSVIAVLFFVLLAFRREALYGPMDYRDDGTFSDLLRKVGRIEAKQDVDRIGKETTLDDVLRTVDKLLELGDTWSAISVGRAFLQEEENEKSLKVFEHIKSQTTKSDEAYYKIIANMAYSQIGLSKFDDAIKSLLELKKISRGAYFRAWHSLALAYSYFRTNNQDEYTKWMKHAKDHGVEDVDLEFFQRIYPEIAAEIKALAE